MIVAELKAEIAKVELRIAAIQKECIHPGSARQSKNRANTGNYDPSCDCYWVEHRCLLCDKFWTENQ